jgi:hypothetical protein
MSKLSRRLFAVALVALAALTSAGAVFASMPSPSDSTGRAPAACFWTWGGPATRWVLTSDGCNGKCSPPDFNGAYLDQQEVTRCNPTSP